jgi:hypothetical protein
MPGKFSDKKSQLVFQIVLDEALLQRSELIERLALQSTRTVSLFAFSGVLFFTSIEQIDLGLGSIVAALFSLLASLLLLIMFRNRKGSENGLTELENDLINQDEAAVKRVYRARVQEILNIDKEAFKKRAFQLSISLLLVGVASISLLAANICGKWVMGV